MVRCAIGGLTGDSLERMAWCGLVATLGLAVGTYVAGTEAIAEAGVPVARGLLLAIQSIVILIS
jgi:hypothetical protein